MEALRKEIASAFDLSDLPILNAFLALDPSHIPNMCDENFASFGTSKLKDLHEFYESDAVDEFQGKITRAEKLLLTINFHYLLWSLSYKN